MAKTYTKYGSFDPQKIARAVLVKEPKTILDKLIPMHPFLGPPLPCGLKIFWPKVKK
jgi:hypothetical protein